MPLSVKARERPREGGVSTAMSDHRSVASLFAAAADEIRAVSSSLDETAFQAAVAEIAEAGRIALHGVGREGLQIRGLAMRLFHLGLSATPVGDMTTPHIGAGDLLIVSAGPGYFETVSAVMRVARAAGARILLVTSQPDGACAGQADLVLVARARTMADLQDADREDGVLPMGSVFEGAQFVLFECLVMAVRARLGISLDAMRARHTNLE